MLPLKKIMSTWTMSETADAEPEINVEVTYQTKS